MGSSGIKRKHWLQFCKLPRKPGKKTDIHEVVNKEFGTVVGLIAWHPPFRKYSFFPFTDMVFDPNCLSDIADQLRLLMENHKNENS